MRLLSVRHASSTLRHLLMHGVALAVRLEQSVLWPSQQRCALLQPQHELAEPLSRRPNPDPNPHPKPNPDPDPNPNPGPEPDPDPDPDPDPNPNPSPNPSP